VISEDILEEPFPVAGLGSIGVGFILFFLGVERKRSNISELIRDSLHEQPLPNKNI